MTTEFQLTAARRRLEDAICAGVEELGFQLTAARRRLGIRPRRNIRLQKFQLTAARRRLAAKQLIGLPMNVVSTHSRPKAAGLNG